MLGTHRNCIHDIFGIFDVDVETLFHEAPHQGVDVLGSVQNILSSCVQILQTLLQEGTGVKRLVLEMFYLFIQRRKNNTLLKTVHNYPPELLQQTFQNRLITVFSVHRE